ncbi:methyltransferase type 12 [Exophiala viscosa]|uniref:Methyltransferase type 12 n=1 Tax=Exophiala viscosa TaxID=2486360 RepID=A0AAN6DLL7_9EURO|nr:methyltransferase type 12 [Exophiala viscosa]
MAPTESSQRLDAEALFDSVGQAYESAFADCSAQRASVTWLLERLPPQASVLDIGCGTGRPVCSSMAAAGHIVLGIDVSGVMIAAATRNVPEASFEKIDIKDFEPANGRHGENMDIAWMGRPIVASSLSSEEVLEVMKAAKFEVLKVENSKYLPRAAQAGICREEDVWEEEHLFVYARK